jgi:hypothetical protein
MQKFILVVSFCAALSLRASAADGVPTSQELFQRGYFLAKPMFSIFGHENHFGEELDLSEKRPAYKLNDTLFGKKYARPGYDVWGNFFQDKQFHIALVPQKGVKSFYFHIAYFPPRIGKVYIAAHSYLRFEMDPKTPIEIVAPMPTEAELKKLRELPEDEALKALPEATSIPVRNIAISGEAQWSKDDPKKAYSLVRGERSAFVQIVRFEGIKERFKDFYTEGRPVDQFEYESKADQDPDSVLAYALARSQSDGLDHIYSTLRYNCTTMAFDIVEKATGVKDSRIGIIRSTIEKRVPTVARYKVDVEGGVKVVPFQLDPSMAEESKAAYEDVKCSKIQTPCDKMCLLNINSAVDAFTKALGTSK